MLYKDPLKLKKFFTKILFVSVTCFCLAAMSLYQFNFLVLFLTLLSVFPLSILSQATQPLSYLSQQKSSPYVVILGDGQSETTTLAIALRTLGYARVDKHGTYQLQPPQDKGSNSSTYTALSSTLLYQDTVLSYPKAKFILPIREKCEGRMRDAERRQPCAHSWLGSLATYIERSDKRQGCDSWGYIDSVRSYFEAKQLEGRLLIIAIDESREGRVDDKWEDLCKFLQLGYSTVERLRLRAFPGKGRGVFWGSDEFAA